MRSTFSIACCRGIPYSRRFRSVKAGACACAASLTIPLLPAIAGLSLPVPGVQLSSITIGRTMYCCLPSTCKKSVPEPWRATPAKTWRAVAMRGATTYQLYSSRARARARKGATLILSDNGQARIQKRDERFRFRAYRSELRSRK